MPAPAVNDTESRVLVFAPTGRDGALAAEVLHASGILARSCEDLEDLRWEIQQGAGAVLLTEEALTAGAMEHLAEVFSGQLPWSDLPVLVFSSRSAQGESVPAVTQRLGAVANLILLDRPTRKVTLISAVRSALRARARQYEVRDLLLQLERGVRDRDRFLAMLGHELRNPLGAILSSVQLLERQRARALAREPDVIHRQTRLLSRLVDDLLDVSRVTSGKITLERLPVDLRTLIARCVQAQAVTAADRRIDLVFEPEEEVAALGDAVRLEQVVNNLLTNAVKYTSPGGRVRVTLSRSDGQAEIRVQDTGVGISHEVLPLVFDMFTQADDTLDRSQGGLGIGLTLVRSLVELHGGSVRAESAGRGEGSTFVVRLPAIPAGAARRALRAEPPVRLPPREILLVEDNADLREGLKLLLEEVGHRVEVAADGAEGIELAVARRPAVALVDIGLPKVDGYAVGRRIRQSLGRSVFLVALTGYGLPEDRRRALEAGFDAHLTKPITLDDVQALLARLDAPEAGRLRSPERRRRPRGPAVYNL
jgi:signal transduction histidine kinase/CheY-like chemotaxis protein